MYSLCIMPWSLDEKGQINIMMIKDFVILHWLLWYCHNYWLQPRCTLCYGLCASFHLLMVSFGTFLEWTAIGWGTGITGLALTYQRRIKPQSASTTYPVFVKNSSGPTTLWSLWMWLMWVAPLPCLLSAPEQQGMCICIWLGTECLRACKHFLWTLPDALHCIFLMLLFIPSWNDRALNKWKFIRSISLRECLGQNLGMNIIC